MILLIHISTAFASLAAATASYMWPSVAKLRLTYILTGGMLVSGTVLVVQNSSHLVRACSMGLIALTIILYQTAVARKRLALEKRKIDSDQ